VHNPLDHRDRGDKRQHDHNPEQHNSIGARATTKYYGGHTEQENALGASSDSHPTLDAHAFSARPGVGNQQ